MSNLEISSAADEGLYLFDLDTVRMDSPRLKKIKQHDIQTHHAPHMEENPWLAIPMHAARAILAGYDLTDEESGSMAAMMAGYCNLLELKGVTFLGSTERDVQDAALEWCESKEINEREKYD